MLSPNADHIFDLYYPRWLTRYDFNCRGVEWVHTSDTKSTPAAKVFSRPWYLPSTQDPQMRFSEFYWTENGEPRTTTRVQLAHALEALLERERAVYQALICLQKDMRSPAGARLGWDWLKNAADMVSSLTPFRDLYMRGIYRFRAYTLYLDYCEHQEYVPNHWAEHKGAVGDGYLPPPATDPLNCEMYKYIRQHPGMDTWLFRYAHYLLEPREWESAELVRRAEELSALCRAEAASAMPVSAPAIKLI